MGLSTLDKDISSLKEQSVDSRRPILGEWSGNPKNLSEVEEQNAVAHGDNINMASKPLRICFGKTHSELTNGKHHLPISTILHTPRLKITPLYTKVPAFVDYSA